MVGTGTGAKLGILIRNAESLERIHMIQSIVLDKTGTITEGKPSVTDVLAMNGFDEEQVLGSAASLESKSEHPLAKAIVEYASNIKLASVETFESSTGIGVAGVVEQKRVAVGNFTRNHEESSSNGNEELFAKLSSQGKTPVFVSIDDTLAGVIAIADTIKPTTPAAIAELHSMGIEVLMLTGDNERTAQAIAGRAGVHRVIAHVMPHEKVACIKTLQSESKLSRWWATASMMRLQSRKQTSALQWEREPILQWKLPTLRS